MQEETMIAATQNGTTEITGIDLVVQHLRGAIAAAQANNTQTSRAEINEASEALSQFEGESVGDLVARLIIIGLSLVAFLAIIIIIRRRQKDLTGYASLAFQYLVVRGGYNRVQLAIETEKKETFDKSLQDIEQYFNNGDWALAEYSLTHLIDEYYNLLTGPKELELTTEKTDDKNQGVGNH
jgi:hypothetical protein